MEKQRYDIGLDRELEIKRFGDGRKWRKGSTWQHKKSGEKVTVDYFDPGLCNVWISDEEKFYFAGDKDDIEILKEQGTYPTYPVCSEFLFKEFTRI
jgi:hypothetical protein